MKKFLGITILLVFIFEIAAQEYFPHGRLLKDNHPLRATFHRTVHASHHILLLRRFGAKIFTASVALSFGLLFLLSLNFFPQFFGSMFLQRGLIPLARSTVI